ncbi:helix-turn-helix domain-containing protein [Rubeoparvulum massiliense]|uniref:helix-turn-helix domain-containing protein n=1 Tax=Rubeoparvulum massiliense TaxID=1631346 RepID=UPI00065DEC4A|nr:helix-turn-helix transcriptional regulator [Rubeoparvulum massiliense]
MHHIGYRLQVLRKLRKLTQRQLAEGISSTGKVSRYENDQEPVPANLIPMFAKRLGVSIDELTGACETQQILEISRRSDSTYRLIHEKEYEEAWAEIQRIKGLLASILNEEAHIDVINLEAIYYARWKENTAAYEVLKGLSAYRFSQYTSLFFRIQITLGILQYNQGKYLEALDHFMLAMERNTKDGSIHEAILYYYLALTHTRISMNAQGTYYAKMAAHLFRQQEAIFNLKETALLRAIIYSDEKRWEESYEQSNIVLQYPINSTREKLQHAKALHNIGIYFREKGEWEKSLEHLKSSLQLKKELGNPSEIAFTMLIICQVYLASHDHDSFLTYITDFENQFASQLLPIHQALMYQMKGEYYVAIESFHKMQREYLFAIEKYLSAGAENYAARLYFLLAEHFNSPEYYAKAARIYNTYFTTNLYRE